MINKTTLVDLMRARRANDSTLVVRMTLDDVRFDWFSLGQCTDCGFPGINYGQDRDCRYPTNGAEGLHAHVFLEQRTIEFHLDDHDACRDAARHAVKDTHVVAGTVGGTLLGAAIGALFGGKDGAAVGALVGGGSGGVVGLATARRKRVIIAFDELLQDAQQLHLMYAW